jgi:GT2 family glycosyltransferase
VIVVDHRGDEETQALACAHGARLISANGRTLAGARQAGIEAARGEIVAFTDDDCLPRPDWIEMLVAAFRRDPALYGVQGRTEAEVGPVGSHAVRVSKPDPLFQTCNIAYRHEALDLAGGFDLQFGGWFEDTALGARVLAHGAIGFEPEAVVVHQAVLRRPFDRARWRSLLKDERRLARKYGWFYRRTRGPGFFPTIIARWLLGSPLKTLVRELPRSQGDPRGYLRLLRALLRERWELVLALWDMSRPSPPSPLSPISGEGEDDVLPSPALRERGRG